MVAIANMFQRGNYRVILPLSFIDGQHKEVTIQVLGRTAERPNRNLCVVCEMNVKMLKHEPVAERNESESAKTHCQSGCFISQMLFLSLLFPTSHSLPMKHYRFESMSKCRRRQQEPKRTSAFKTYFSLGSHFTLKKTGYWAFEKEAQVETC